MNNDYEFSKHARAWVLPLVMLAALAICVLAPRRDAPVRAQPVLTQPPSPSPDSLHAIGVMNAGRWLNANYTRRQYDVDCTYAVVNGGLTCRVTVMAIDSFDEEDATSVGASRFYHTFYITCPTTYGGSCELTR